MAQETLVPWAERVPDAASMTVDELLRLPDDSRWRYELVEGRLVRMAASGGEAAVIATELLTALNSFVRAHGLGRVTGADGTYDLTQPGDEKETGLVPDVAFVRAEQVPPRTSPDYAEAWRLAPDLVAEVVSPTQYRPEMESKARRYLAAGVRLVWIVWPKYQQADVWHPGSDQPVTTLNAVDALDGLDVVPGFVCPLASLFA